MNMSVWSPVLVLWMCITLHDAIAQDTPRCDFDLHAATWDLEMREVVESIIQKASTGIHTRSTITIPVVFHIVWYHPSENISDLQIRSQVDILNRDFAFHSENVFRIPDTFYLLGAESGIRFCLAASDPEGRPATGITRTQTIVPGIGIHRHITGRKSVHYSIYGGQDAWDPERYLNIWVASMDGALLGSATFPGLAPHPEEDGVVIDPHYVGALGLAAQSAPYDRGHTLTHELGHYFGLLHTWGPGLGGCGEDDLVEDTPLQATFYTGCPQHPEYSCGSADMFMNFMDFTHDRCLALFTYGQVLRMHGALHGLRAGLLSQQSICSPADTGKLVLEEMQVFYAPGDRRIVCVLDRSSDVTRHVRIYAMDGRLMGTGAWYTGATYWIEARTYPTGVYVVRIEAEGEVIARKLLVP